VDTDRAEIMKEVGLAFNNAAEANANKALGDNLGTKWRGLNYDLADAKRAEEFAERGSRRGGDQVRGLKTVALASADPGMLAGLVASSPGVQMRFWQGAKKASELAAKPVHSTIEKILARAPSGPTLGRIAVNQQAQEAVTAVQEAALRGDEEAVTEHYRQMLTNPSYNRTAIDTE
jgi:hypothetical protein